MPLGRWSISSDAGTRRHTDLYTLIRDNPAIYQNLHETWQTTGGLVARTQAGALAIALGADAAHNQLASNRLGDQREWRAGVFAEGVFGTSANSSLALGVRGDRSSDFGSFLSPSLRGSWQILPDIQLYASGARAFRAPDFTERYYTDPSNIGNPTLRPERFWTGDVGARVSVGAASLDVTGFTRSASDLIDWVKPASADSLTPWRAMNIGTATYRGIESRIEFAAIRDVTFAAFGSGVWLTSAQGASLIGKYALRPVTRKVGGKALEPVLKPREGDRRP